MKTQLTIGLFAWALACVPGRSNELPIAKLTLAVTDQNHVVIEGADVTMSFEEPTPKWGGGIPVTVRGKTDGNGKFEGSGHSFDTKGGQVVKAGFYTCWAEPFKFQQSIDNKWQPWNPIVQVV